MIDLGALIYCRILRHRRTKYRDEKYARLSAAILMALPLVLMFNIAQDAIASALGVRVPIEYIDKWIYLFGVCAGAAYLIHRLFATGDRFSKAGSCLDAAKKYSGQRANLIVLAYYIVPLTLWTWYFDLL